MTTLGVQAPGLVSVTIPVDVGIPMNVAGIDGTAITATMLNNHRFRLYRWRNWQWLVFVDQGGKRV